MPMSDFRLLGEILIDVLPLLNFTPEDIRLAKRGTLDKDSTDSSDYDV